MVRNKEIVPTFRVEPLDLKMLGGKVELFANLDVGNVLPGPLKSIWKAVVGKGLEYTYPLIIWSGIDREPIREGADIIRQSYKTPKIVAEK